MRRIGILLSTYLLRSIVPYFFFAWILLSVILFVQQASKFSETFFNANLPASLVWQLMGALVPNVVAFTCPMAVLIGTVIGLTKMQGDSELVALRAAGVGNLQILIPVTVLGILLSAFAFVVNVKGVPLASSLVRKVALTTAIQKLESPIEPGLFNTEVSGYTIYVRSGDITSGRWQDIFVFQKDPSSGSIRLITSREGRIDVSDEQSELVLENAEVATLPGPGTGGKLVSERIGDIRFAIKTRRSELIERLSTAQAGIEEMGLSQLAEVASSDTNQRREAQILWQRRVLLSITPFIFCLLGTVMVLPLNRGGRGLGVFLSLGALVIYYLAAFFGEQIVRAGNAAPIVGGLVPIVVVIGLGSVYYYLPPANIFGRIGHWLSQFKTSRSATNGGRRRRMGLSDLSAGLRDLDVLAEVIKFFALSLAFTTLLFMIFTAFELWKFAGSMEGGIYLLLKYLFFLLPFAYLQLAPTAAMLAILAAYIIKSRNNELVTWVSAGQSVFRLLAPCLIACFALGLANWIIQENVLPRSNATQDAIRTQIRSRGTVAQQSGGRFWYSDGSGIYTFQLISASDNANSGSSTTPGADETASFASDNEKNLKEFIGFRFSGGERKLQTLYRAENAVLRSGEIHIDGPYQEFELNSAGVTASTSAALTLPVAGLDLTDTIDKPSHLNSRQLADRIRSTDSDTERRLFSVILHKRYTTFLLPLIVALLAAPFALNLSRKNKVMMAGYAIALWLFYMGASSIFEQWGNNGQLPAALAVWSPTAGFAAIGTYLLSRVRT